MRRRVLDPPTDADRPSHAHDLRHDEPAADPTAAARTPAPDDDGGLTVHVVVAGAGVGGLALAHALRRTPGVRVQVLERSAHLPTGGAAVTLYANGCEALTRWGIDTGTLGAPVTELRFLRADGRRISSSAQRGVRSVPRTDLVRTLADGLSPGTLLTGTTVVGVEPRAVVLADGTHLRADLIVGADGASSAVRAAVLADAGPRRTGWTSAQALLRGPLPPLAAAGVGTCHVGPAGLCGLLPAGPDLLQWWCDSPTTADRLDADALRRAFAGYHRDVTDVLERIPDRPPTHPHVVQHIPDTWGRGAVTLVGDAAHAVPPTLAQGANQALDDAWTLAEALRRGDDPTTAARAYERHRVPRVRRMSRLAASERTNRVPGAVTRTLAPLVPAALAGAAHRAAVRSWSSVLAR